MTYYLVRVGSECLLGLVVGLFVLVLSHSFLVGSSFGFLAAFFLEVGWYVSAYYDD